MKIYVAAVEALRRRERQDETHKICEFQPPSMLIYSFNANVLFFLVSFFLNLTTMYDQTQGSGAVFSLLYE